MAKIGNETKLILKLAKERHQNLKDSRTQTPNEDYQQGYHRCFDDVWRILDEIVLNLESK